LFIGNDELKVDQPFLTILTGIEKEFFAQYREKEERFFSVDDLSVISRL